MKKCLLNTGGQPKEQVVMVEMDELNLKQAHHYVLLHVGRMDFYRRLFLEERIAFCSQEPTERLKQKWLPEDFPYWLQQMVPNVDTNDPKSKVLKAVAEGQNSMVKRIKVFSINGYTVHTQDRDEAKTTQNYGL